MLLCVQRKVLKDVKWGRLVNVIRPWVSANSVNPCFRSQARLGDKRPVLMITFQRDRL